MSFPGHSFRSFMIICIQRKYDVRAGASSDAGRACHMCLASLLRSFFSIIYSYLFMFLFLFMYMYILI